MIDARLDREALLGPIAVLLTNSLGHVSWCNDSAVRLLHISEADIIGKPVSEILVSDQSDGGSLWSGQAYEHFKLSDGGVLTAVHMQLQRPTGDAHYLVEAGKLSKTLRELECRERLWHNALEASGHAVWAFQRAENTNFEDAKNYYSDNWWRMRGLPDEASQSDPHANWFARIHPDDREHVAHNVHLQNTGLLRDISFEYRERHANGQDIWVLARGKTIAVDKAGLPLHIIGLDADITSVKAKDDLRVQENQELSTQHLRELEMVSHIAERARVAAEANAFRESIWRQAVGAAGYGVWSYRVDHSGSKPETKVEFCSDTWFDIRGATTSQHELHDYDFWISRVHPEDVENVLACTARQASGEEHEVSFEFREMHAKGHWVWILVRGTATDFDDQGRPHRVIGIDIDISNVKEDEAKRARDADATYSRHLLELREAGRVADEARQEAQDLARRDMATGLANRRLFRERITELISTNVDFTVFLIDLDHFKTINDVHGHGAGDHVLLQSALRLKQTIAGDGFAARLGGDEFGVILRHEAGLCPNKLKSAAANLIANICQPISHGDLVLYVGASIGSCNFPDDGSDYDILLQHADMALYKAKVSSRGNLSIYTSLMGLEAADKAALEADLRTAINTEQIEPWFQPIVNADGEVVKLEILARWHHPTRGFVPPDKFIAVAEHIGMLPELTMSILRKSCALVKGMPEIKLSLNITAREACDAATPLRILDGLLQAGFAPRDMEIEITEQALIFDFVSAKQVVAALRAADIKVYIDDFGEGYAGIGYLRELAIDGIKFDRSCVKDICNSPQAATFLKSLQIMATTLACETVAEGIETAEIWEKVRSIGCNHGQGYHFARPMPAKNVAVFLEMRSKSQGNVVAFSRS